MSETKLPTGFGRLWTAQTVSSLGDGVTQAALPLLALTLTRNPMALAVVTAAGTLPWLLVGELGVGSGTGLLNLCEIAARVTAETGVAFELVGFDTGRGMPRPRDYRD